jgi:hypothetical protein
MKACGVEIITLLVALLVIALVTYHLYRYFDLADAARDSIQKVNESMSLPHLTIYDGQALCERIAALEKEPKPCEFVGGWR